MALHRPLRSSFNSLSDDLSRGGNELRAAQFGKIPATVKINNAFGNSDLLVICGLCKLNPQCKPIRVTHRHVVQLGCHASNGRSCAMGSHPLFGLGRSARMSRNSFGPRINARLRCCSSGSGSDGLSNFSSSLAANFDALRAASLLTGRLTLLPARARSSSLRIASGRLGRGSD